MEYETALSIMENRPGYEEMHKAYMAGDPKLKKDIEEAFAKKYPGEYDLSNF